MMLKYLIIFLALGGGAMVSAICGFGMGVFAMMILPYVLASTNDCAAIVGLTSIFQAAMICYTYFKKVQWKDMLFMIIGYLIFATIGVISSKYLAAKTLKLILGIFLVTLSVYFIFIAKKLQIKRTKQSALIAGSLGGIMSSLFGVGGPPASLYYSSAYEDKEMYIGTIQTYFLITNLYTTTFRAINGIIGREVLLCIPVTIAGMLIGNALGKKIFDRINADTLRKLIYIMMAISGIVMIIESI